MRSVLVCLFLAALSACSPKQLEALSAAERAAAVLACKVDVVEPYFDSADDARRFVLDAIAGKVSPSQALLMFSELGLSPEQISDVVERFRDCTPARPAPPAAQPKKVWL